MNLHIVFVVFIFGNSIVSLCDGSDWNYADLGPDVWEDFYPACASTAQSPINIKTECTTYQSFPSFQFSSDYNVSQDFLLTNNGHTIAGTQVNQTAFPLTLSGGGLNETFTFVNFHLHWGENYKSGSEHQVNGQKYSGEVHFVHKNAAGTQYAVLGIFMQSSPSQISNHSEANQTEDRRKRRTGREVHSTSNTTFVEWESYFTTGDDLSNTSQSVVLKLNLATLMGSNLDNFYRYYGSLTTPPCTENVIWTVFQTPVMLNEFELASFRSRLYFEDFRGPQPVNGRTVYRNFPNATRSSIPDYNCCQGYNQTEQTTPAPGGSSNGYSVLLMNKQLLTYFSLFFSVICFFLF